MKGALLAILLMGILLHSVRSADVYGFSLTIQHSNASTSPFTYAVQQVGAAATQSVGALLIDGELKGVSADDYSGLAAVFGLSTVVLNGTSEVVPIIHTFVRDNAHLTLVPDNICLGPRVPDGNGTRPVTPAMVVAAQEAVWIVEKGNATTPDLLHWYVPGRFDCQSARTAGALSKRVALPTGPVRSVAAVNYMISPESVGLTLPFEGTNGGIDLHAVDINSLEIFASNATDVCADYTLSTAIGIGVANVLVCPTFGAQPSATAHFLTSLSGPLSVPAAPLVRSVAAPLGSLLFDWSMPMQLLPFVAVPSTTDNFFVYKGLNKGNLSLPVEVPPLFAMDTTVAFLFMSSPEQAPPPPATTTTTGSIVPGGSDDPEWHKYALYGGIAAGVILVLAVTAVVVAVAVVAICVFQNREFLMSKINAARGADPSSRPLLDSSF